MTGGGTGDKATSTQDGGGIAIWHASPSIVNTLVNSCTARNGGGVYVNAGSPTFDNVLVWFSHANLHGGGFYLQNGGEVTITSDSFGDNGTVLGNSATQDGGGFYMFGVTATLSGLRVYWNTASSGGGIAISNTPNRIKIQSNDISINKSTGPGTDGAGIYAFMATNLEIADNTIGGNRAIGSDSSGGGIYLYSTGPATVTNNILARNSAFGDAGGGVAIIRSPAQLINNTIADNIGDGVLFSQAEGVAIVNNIISGNSDYGIEYATTEGTTTISTTDYNDLFGNTTNAYSAQLAPGAHDLAVDPQFVAAGGLTAYYHILDTSPVSVTGSTSWAPQRDIDGDLRILGGSVSMGADEIPGAATIPVYLPLLLRSSS